MGETGYTKSIDVSRSVDETKVALQNEHNLARESLSNALKGYENFHKTYVPHTIMQMSYIDLSEDKTLLAKISH